MVAVSPPRVRTHSLLIEETNLSGRQPMTMLFSVRKKLVHTSMRVCVAAMAASSAPPRRRRSCTACFALAISALYADTISGASAFSSKVRERASSRVPQRRVVCASNSAELFAGTRTSGIIDADYDDGGSVRRSLASMSNRLKGSCSNACSAYMSWLERKPLSANAISAGVIALLGDIIAQLIEARVGTFTSIGGNKLNVLRMASFAASGMVFVGPYLHIFYGYLWTLGSHLQKRYNTSRKQQVLLQVLLDQTIGIILFYPVYYYVYDYCEAILGLQALGPVLQRATTKMMSGGNLLSVFLANWIVWIPAQLCTFAFVPESLRVIVSNIVSVFWNCYLCSKVA